MSVRAAVRLIGICASGRRWNESIPLCRRALEAHQQFEAKTISELGLLPSARMQELAERIGPAKA
jgi:hypothetical protein